MKLSEYKNEEALDILADILEPAAKIFSDKDVKQAFEKGDKISGIKAAIKGHKTEIIEILARLDNVPVEEYECNILTLPVKIMEILNDTELINFFSSQRQTEQNPVSVAVTGTTMETEKI